MRFANFLITAGLFFGSLLLSSQAQACGGAYCGVYPTMGYSGFASTTAIMSGLNYAYNSCGGGCSTCNTCSTCGGFSGFTDYSNYFDLPAMNTGSSYMNPMSSMGMGMMNPMSSMGMMMPGMGGMGMGMIPFMPPITLPPVFPPVVPPYYPPTLGPVNVPPTVGSIPRTPPYMGCDNITIMCPDVPPYRPPTVQPPIFTPPSTQPNPPIVVGGPIPGSPSVPTVPSVPTNPGGIIPTGPGVPPVNHVPNPIFLPVDPNQGNIPRGGP